MRNHDHHLTDQQLLLALDHELPSRRHASVEAHLAQCVACRARQARIGQAAGSMTAFYKDDVRFPAGAAGRTREALRLKLNEMAREWDGSWRARLASAVMPGPRWVMTGVALAAPVLLFLVMSPSSSVDSSSLAASIERGALPVPSLTPGASRNLSVGEVCAGGAREPQEVPVAVRGAVLRAYGMEHVPYDEYELDYLITPELGGVSDARNLWPQRYASHAWNARVKDQLEELLPQLVCNAQVTLETAQRDIALDWIAAYRKYFKTETPLQAQAGRWVADAVAARVLRHFWRYGDWSALSVVTSSPARPAT